jgi:hypothetical protein
MSALLTADRLYKLTLLPQSILSQTPSDASQLSVSEPFNTFPVEHHLVGLVIPIINSYHYCLDPMQIP